jgi:Ca-activated chloride channel family protein
VRRAWAGGLALLALGTVAAAGAARPESQKTPVFGVGLDLVNVTVTVRDGRGGLVAGLGSDDFVVREDGRPQRIEVFAPAAAQIHTGERATRSARLHCTRCGEVVPVAEGEIVPECPRGHRTFDIGERDQLALNLGMLFDTSESMRKDLKLSQESAIRFLDAIPRARDLLLIFFDRDIRLSRYSSENQQGIFERILDTEGGGLTAFHDAVTVYLSRVADTPGRKVLVVFTDGDDTTSQTSPQDVLRFVRLSDVVIYPVAFRGEHRSNSTEALRARSFLASLAELSGGRVFQPAASKELAAIYQSILDELSTQYVIGYVSDNPARDGKFRKITVEVARPSLKLRYRPGYDAPKDAPPRKPEK